MIRKQNDARKEYMEICSDFLDQQFAIEGVDEVSVRIETRCTSGGTIHHRGDYSMHNFEIQKQDYLNAKFKGDFKKVVQK